MVTLCSPPHPQSQECSLSRAALAQPNSRAGLLRPLRESGRGCEGPADKTLLSPPFDGSQPPLPACWQLAARAACPKLGEGGLEQGVVEKISFLQSIPSSLCRAKAPKTNYIFFSFGAMPSYARGLLLALLTKITPSLGTI